MSTSKCVFENFFSNYHDILKELTAEFVGKKISIMNLDEFENIMRSDLVDGHSKYWEELLSRAYLSAAIGLQRSHQWIGGTLTSINDENFYSFSANLRGLLENSADMSYSIRDVPKTLAQNCQRIKHALDKTVDNTEILISKDIEDRLLHFVYARRTTKRDSLPESHSALTTRAYLKDLQGNEAGPVMDLYSELCGITHPAVLSLSHCWRELENGMIEVTALPGTTQINDLCGRHEAALVWMTAGINSAVLLLKVLNEFPVASLHTIHDLVTETDPPGWPRLKELLTKK